MRKVWMLVLVLSFLLLLNFVGYGQEAETKAGWFDFKSWVDFEKRNVFIALLLFAGFFFAFLFLARIGRELYLRRVPGLDALEEAVGRATEMGKPVLYVPGIDDIDEIQTLASMVILGHVAKTTAQYGSPIIVPCRSPVVMSVAEETVKQSCISAGKPDAYIADNIRYLSSDQFAYTAGVDGIMLRERPAANIYIGGFYAESLILAETGFSAGAIQIAGTASIAQLPFFITACDYTIIAEEFYAASAYLSREPNVLSSIKSSDYFKVVVIILILVGIILAHLKPEWVTILKAWF